LYYDHWSILVDKMRKNILDKEQLADVGYLLRQGEKLLDDWRKDCKAAKELAGKIIALQILQSAESLSGEGEDVARGDIAIAIPDLKMEAELPKKGTPEYEAFLGHFGVNAGTAELGILKPDWKAIGKLVTDAAQDGKKFPPGLGKKYPRYTATFRRR
jgi:hypothetical protein